MTLTSEVKLQKDNNYKMAGGVNTPRRVISGRVSLCATRQCRYPHCNDAVLPHFPTALIALLPHRNLLLLANPRQMTRLAIDLNGAVLLPNSSKP